MSYSCTSTEAVCNSQDAPNASAKKAATNNTNRGSGDLDSSSSRSPSSRQSHPKPLVAMKVKKGCNSTDAGVPVTSEDELLRNPVISPEDVLGLQKITESK